MTLDCAQKRTDLRHGYRELGLALPGAMAGFGDIHRAAVADGELSRATKELIALAIGVAVLMGGGPASVSATEALVALEQFSAERQPTNVAAN
jgi:alkylhydroperoxidase/carboxymuconolactone decarboxylase family protein YurZ